MQKHRAVLGGEGNGGVIDPRVGSRGRDGIVSMIWVLKLLAEGNIKMSDIVKTVPKPAIHKNKISFESRNDCKGILEKIKGNIEKLIKKKSK